MEATGSIIGGTPAYDVENRLLTVGTKNVRYNYASGNKRVWRGVWTGAQLTTDEITFWSVKRVVAFATLSTLHDGTESQL